MKSGLRVALFVGAILMILAIALRFSEGKHNEQAGAAPSGATASTLMMLLPKPFACLTLMLMILSPSTLSLSETIFASPEALETSMVSRF
jgi:hypothetical protein